MPDRQAWACILALVLAGCGARAKPPDLGAVITCDRPAVSDGDTIRCGGQRVRIWGVNSPELRHDNLGIAPEPGGEAARARMVALTRTGVSCVPAGDGRDRYGRLVGRCWTASTPDLGAEMVREGLACQWRRYSHGAYDGQGRDCDRRGK